MREKCWLESLNGRDNSDDLGVRRENNIKTNLREMGLEGVDWIHLTQYREQWRTVVDTVMYIQVLYNGGEFLDYLRVLLAPQGLCSME
jgi:hypothetical protein